MAQAAWTQACEAQFPGVALAGLLQTDIRKLEGDRVPLPKMEDVEGIIAGPFILQIISVVDGTKPSSKQQSGHGGQVRVLLLRLTDGTTSKFTAIELARIPKLSMDTPPGTKLLLGNVRYVKHKLLLEPSSVLGLDGVVEVLANNFRSSRLLEQQYKLGKDLQVKKKNAGGEGPPAFDAFKPGAPKSGGGAGGGGASSGGLSQGKSKPSPSPAPASLPSAPGHADGGGRTAPPPSSYDNRGPSTQGRGGQDNYQSSRGRGQARGRGRGGGGSSARGGGPLPPPSSLPPQYQQQQCYGGSYDGPSPPPPPPHSSSSYRGGGRGGGGGGAADGYGSSRGVGRGGGGGRDGGRGRGGDRGGRGGRRGGRGGGYGPSSASAEPSIHSLAAHFQRTRI